MNTEKHELTVTPCLTSGAQKKLKKKNAIENLMQQLLEIGN